MGMMPNSGYLEVDLVVERLPSELPIFMKLSFQNRLRKLKVEFMH
jgi:hypothetical protein